MKGIWRTAGAAARRNLHTRRSPQRPPDRPQFLTPALPNIPP
ncbi:hypothetical protein [Limnothrix redekei]|uniref:Uncharacterized protein n=1 Tax=Limnothrix redekei LRLZ20PSL1 TaxID=3112953 RepID=A0ABW7CFB3_9CYAN